MNKKEKKKLYKLIIALIIILISILSSRYFSEPIVPVVNNIETYVIPEEISLEDENLKIFLFDVGQADSTLVIYKGELILIDAGEDNNGEFLVGYMKRLGISKLDYVIGTHVHSDHIGGLDKIIKAFEIENIYMPYTGSDNTSKEYREVLEEVIKKDMEITNPSIGDVFYINDAICEIKYVDNKEPDNINLASIVIQISLDEQEYLFMGDAEKEIEDSVRWKDVDILKVAHHGSSTSSSVSFLEQTLPEISVISAGKNNQYGHPSQTVLDRLNKIKTAVYRTDVEGTIFLTNINGENIVSRVTTNF